MDKELELLQNIYSRYSDEQLRKEYNIYEKIMDIDDIVDSVLIDYLDNYIEPALKSNIISRFMQSSKKIIYFE